MTTIGTPLSPHATRVLLLGSGELGKEVALELQRFGVEVIAADRYADAPAMQVAHRSHVINMLDGAALRAVIELEKPHFMLLAGVCGADTDAEAEFLRSSQILAFARLLTGQAGKLPLPSHDLSHIPKPLRAQIDHSLSCAAIGSPATLRTQLGKLIETHKPDEIMLTGMIHDHAARLHSFDLAAQAMQSL